MPRVSASLCLISISNTTIPYEMAILRLLFLYSDRCYHMTPEVQDIF